MKKYLSDYVRLIKTSKNYHIAFIAVYAAGIIFGVLFSTGASKFLLGESVINFYVNALSKSGRVWSLIFSRLLSDLFFLVVFYFCSYLFYAVFFCYAFVFYRGYVLASVSVIFIKLFGVSGAFVYILCVLVHNVIVSAALSSFAGIAAAHCKRKSKRLKSLRNDLVIVSMAAILIAVVLEVFILVMILRPLHVTL